MRGFVATGGKRLRPAFCYCAFVGADGDPDDPRVVDAAAALELVHTFALAHDDVMDGSEMRRGNDSVHAPLRAAVTPAPDGAARPAASAKAWRSSSATSRSPTPTCSCAACPTPRTSCSTSCASSCASASRSTSRAPPSASTEAELANRIAVYKSGKYTVERPLHLGAALADGLAPLGPALSAIGLPLGHAFQLRDDVLGAFGDAEVTGKPVGDDLREGKPTPLVALAFARAGAADRELLGRLGDPRPHRRRDRRAAGRVRAHGRARGDRGRHRAARRARPATRSANAPLADTARAWLDELAAYVAWRDR